MKVGDYCHRLGGLVIREMTFKEYCDRHDDLMLEYDIDDAWEAWQRMGPCFEVMKDGRLMVFWPPEGSEETENL
jgi:hypothetical protein|tara:strand:+ start:558 stop:779 length:222 start_codon:yes stop_codon:yes gene_type:complete